MKPRAFEQTGWSRVDISAEAQERIAREFAATGIGVETLDLTAHKDRFEGWLGLPEYEGEYRHYAGELLHCLQEKALEHFLSVVLAAPEAGMTAVDIGSCRSVAPRILRRLHGVRCLEQDLSYPAGVQGDRVGGSADDMPLDDASVDFMTLHCTFEHFEGAADSGFVRECGRVLRPGGRTVILPLYLNATHCNVTGVSEPATRTDIGWDSEADHYCEVPEWRDRFGRHYSVPALLERVIAPARGAGLVPRVFKVVNWDAVDPRLWLRWVLVLERQEPAQRPAAESRLREVRALRDQLGGLRERLEALEADAERRLHERNLLQAQLAELRGQFEFVEADRIARGEVIERQGARTSELERLVFLTEQNRDWHKGRAERLEADIQAQLRGLGEELEALRGQVAEREAWIERTSAGAWHRLGRRLKLV
jgi:SAM-dependent methyltransferase